ncbi:MAG: DUF1257 domain-containing protein [Pirellulales bacterium]
MSHIVEIQTEVRDAAAIRAASRRLCYGEPTFGEARLFSGTVTGWQVRLPAWRYPLVCDTATGKIHYDHYNGRWGSLCHLDAFLQIYAVEKAKLESRRAGHDCSEQQLADGSIQLTIHVGEAV